MIIMFGKIVSPLWPKNNTQKLENTLEYHCSLNISAVVCRKTTSIGILAWRLLSCIDPSVPRDEYSHLQHWVSVDTEYLSPDHRFFLATVNFIKMKMKSLARITKLLLLLYIQRLYCVNLRLAKVIQSVRSWYLSSYLSIQK